MYVNGILFKQKTCGLLIIVIVILNAFRNDVIKYLTYLGQNMLNYFNFNSFYFLCVLIIITVDSF